MNKLWRRIKYSLSSIGSFFVEHKWVFAKVFAYFLIVVIFYFIFLWFLFPYNELVANLSNKIRNKTSIDMRVGKASGAFPLGLELNDVIVSKSANREESPILEARTIKITPGILSLLRGEMSFKIYAELYGGQIWVEFKRINPGFSVSGVIKGIYIDKYSMIKSRYGLNVKGVLNAKFNIKGSTNDVTKDSGRGLISMKNVILQSSKILGILTLPEIKFGDITIPVFMKEGRINIQDALQTSKDINSQLTGNIIMTNLARNSILNLKLKFNPTPQTEQKIRRAIPFFMLSRDTSGYFNLSIGGNFNIPRFTK